MKNFILLIIFSIIFNFSASAHSNKAIDKIEEKTNKVEHKKPKLDLKVEKQKKSKDKFVNWDNKKDTKNLTLRNQEIQKEKHSKDFHKWANKTKDSIELNLKKKNQNYHSTDPFLDERHK